MLERIKWPEKKLKKRYKKRNWKAPRGYGDAADGPPVGGEHWTLTVPEGDPLLQKLIEHHGNDTICRDVLPWEKSA